METYQDLVVWQKAKELAVLVYKETANFPPEEKYGLSAQMRRAAVSIPSNIAEGKLRNSQKEFKRFLLISFGSGGELETQIQIAKELEHLDNTQLDKIEDLLTEVMKMLNTMINNRTD